MNVCIFRAALFGAIFALPACSTSGNAGATPVPQEAAAHIDYAPLAAYVGRTCTGHIGASVNIDTYRASNSGAVVDHAYSLKTGLTHTGGMYHTYGLAIKATGDKKWPYQFTSPVSGSVQMLAPVAGAQTLDMRINANGTWRTLTYACK